jgi:hypothetical protein
MEDLRWIGLDGGEGDKGYHGDDVKKVGQMIDRNFDRVLSHALLMSPRRFSGSGHGTVFLNLQFARSFFH